jgi:hypothetical protein
VGLWDPSLFFRMFCSLALQWVSGFQFCSTNTSTHNTHHRPGRAWTSKLDPKQTFPLCKVVVSLAFVTVMGS